MSGSHNQVELIGNLGKDPDIRTMQSGEKIANLSIATSETWKNKSTGEKKERTQWHRVVIFGKLAEVVERYARKGTKVFVSGCLENRSWEQDGETKYATEVVLRQFNSKLVLLSRNENAVQESQADILDHTDIDDDIPF